MRVYTIKDFDTFDRDEDGRVLCPSGDYTQIKEFPERCIFGDGCMFSADSYFGEGCSFGVVNSTIKRYYKIECFIEMVAELLDNEIKRRK